jgi:hypothetical protein
MSAPTRIYGWRESQLSIARHWGECLYNGHRYVIAYSEEGQPLVRADALKSEAKQARARAIAAGEAGSGVQGDLLGETRHD